MRFSGAIGLSACLSFVSPLLPNYILIRNPTQQLTFFNSDTNRSVLFVFFCCSRKNAIILRTQLSVRVHTIIGEYHHREFLIQISRRAPTIHLDGSSTRVDSSSLNWHHRVVSRSSYSVTCFGSPTTATFH